MPCMPIRRKVRVMRCALPARRKERACPRQSARRTSVESIYGTSGGPSPAEAHKKNPRPSSTPFKGLNAPLSGVPLPSPAKPFVIPLVRSPAPPSQV